MNKIEFPRPAYDSQADANDAEPRAQGPMAWLRRAAIIGAPILVLGGGVALFMVLQATGPKPEQNDEAPLPFAVQVTAAETRNTAIAINVQGEVRPRTQSTLAAQVSGRVVWVNPSFVDGGAFRQGDTLLRLDSADAELAVVRARAQVAQAQEGLSREEAESDLARQDWEELGQGTPSPLVLREPQLAQARAALAAAEAQMRAAELELSRTRIAAPFTGRVMQRRATVGDYVGPGVGVATLFATDIMEVRVPLTDGELAAMNIPIGYTAPNPANAPLAHLSAVSSGQRQTWEGRLVRTEASVEAQTRLVYGIIEVRDPFGTRNPAPLAPGLFVAAELDSPAAHSLVAVPRSALKRNGFIYVVGPENQISIRPVRPTNTTATHVYFEDGLAVGERVVISALPSPREGMSVTPMSASQAGAPAAAE